jgi:hypothetical protein
MLNLVKLKKTTFYIMVISAAAVILAISVDTLLRANNEVLFKSWLMESSFTDATDDQLYRVYLGSLMVDYFFRLIVPVVFGLQTYFAYTKSGVGIVYKAVWTVVLGGMLFVTILNFDTSSPAYYISGIAYVIIIISILRIKHNSQKTIGG